MFLETLVRLANIGAAGVCILTVACVAYVLKAGTGLTPDTHKTLRNLMITGVVMAGLTALASGFNAFMDYQRKRLQDEAAVLTDKNKELEGRIRDCETKSVVQQLQAESRQREKEEVINRQSRQISDARASVGVLRADIEIKAAMELHNLVPMERRSELQRLVERLKRDVEAAYALLSPLVLSSPRP